MVIDGKKIAESMLKKIKPSKILTMAAVLVGNDTELKKFLELKKRAAEKLGIGFKIYQFDESISNSQLRRKVNEIAKTKTIDGVIIELPLPKGINTQYILNTIPEEKDLDVLSGKAQGSFFANKNKVLPPAVEALKQILDFYDIDVKGKKTAVFGYGLLVGKPVSHWLKEKGATVSVINEFTRNPAGISKEADIIVSGVGRANLIREDMVEEGAIIVDFGRDADFENISKKAGLITPHIGGVGPIVVAAVIKNLVELNR